LNKEEKYIPEIKSQLKSRIIDVPSVIYKASGIKFLGTRIKSLLFCTDVAIIKNTNANVLIIVGEKELKIIKKSALKLNNTILNSQLYIAPNMNHGELSLVNYEKYITLIKEFFIN